MSRRGPARACPGRRLRARVLVLLAVVLASAPQAQTVVDVLQQQRRDARLAEVMEALGPRVPPRAAVELGEPDRVIAAFRAVQAERQRRRDSLVAAEDARADSLILAAQLATLSWRKVEPGAQQDFVEQYAEAYWQAADPRPGLVDSLGTAALRGRLQAAFGDPTRNADAQRRHGYGGSEYIQFEYWFVVNDSIPVLAFDLDGPFGRGLLIATDEPHASIVPYLKADLSRQLAAARRPDPWVDYYHSYERRRWFRTGFNGTESFTVEVRPPSWSGREETQRWVIHR